MPEFDDLAIRDDYENHSVEKQNLIDELKKLVINSKSSLEGNCFYVHGSIDLYPELYSKQLNLFWCGKQALTKICEIGFNAGHSTMLMLLGRDKTPLDFTVFDIGHHSYTKPCLKYIKSQFQHVNFEYIEGDSTVTIPKWMEINQIDKESYDVVHVDGGHSEHCISNDMKNADILVKKGGILIIDDTNIQYINKYVDLYISSGKYSEMDLQKTKGYPHRIIKKNISTPVVIYKKLENRIYSWEDNSITFLENGVLNAFGRGTYIQLYTCVFQAAFGGRMHSLVFNNDYTEFTSTRSGDGYIVKGKLMASF